MHTRRVLAGGDAAAGVCFFLLVGAALLGTCASCGGRHHTVAGPETGGLWLGSSAAKRDRLVVVWEAPRGKIVACELQDARDSVVHQSSHVITAVSGPDIQGRVAFIEAETASYSLKTVTLEGREETTVFERQGSATWPTDGVLKVGRHLAISPRDGKVAILKDLHRRQMPGALLGAGSIEIWDLATKTSVDAGVTSMDETLSWLADNRTVIYSSLTMRSSLPDRAVGFGLFGGYVSSWSAVPAIYALDTATGRSTFLSVGWQAVAGARGKSVMVGGWVAEGDRRWIVVDLATGREQPMAGLPGDWLGPIAEVDEGLVLFVGLPTAGREVRFADNHSPLRNAPQMMSIKVVDLTTGAFETMVPYIDPRISISVGRIPR